MQKSFSFFLFFSLFTITNAFIATAMARPSLPATISPPGEKLILVDPRIHVWGAYDSDGYLVKSGVASAGKNWCPDTKQPCRTRTGSFRIYHLGDASCYSTRFPLPHGGAPMPYCMYFNGYQALHGSYEVGYANLSHGCVRLRVSDAKWLRYNFIDEPNAWNSYQGTLVVIRPY